LLPKILKDSKKVLFNGDGYSEEWHKEAEKRGLPNLKNTVDALAKIVSKESLELFAKYKVYNEAELRSRFTILCENYVKVVTVEAKLTSFMAKTMIIPACLRYQTEVAGAVATSKAAGVEATTSMELLKTLNSQIITLSTAVAKLDAVLAHHASGEPYDHSKYSRDAAVPAMNEVRAAADKLEAIVADDLWPIPTYREMLFIK
jgi:glutamine synthetase